MKRIRLRRSKDRNVFKHTSKLHPKNQQGQMTSGAQYVMRGGIRK